MLDIKIDLGQCQNFAQCVWEAPNVFALDADDVLIFQATAHESEREAVQRAVDSCPMQALTLVP
jgi:ferredoxin